MSAADEYASFDQLQGFAAHIHDFCGTHASRSSMAPAALRHGQFAPASPRLLPANEQESPVVIDLICLFTPDAIAGAGSETRLRQQLQESIGITHEIFDRSRINVRLNLLFAGRIQYTETGNMGLDLDNVALGRGEMARGQALRREYKADLVCLITETDNRGVSGQAWGLPSPRW